MEIGAINTLIKKIPILERVEHKTLDGEIAVTKSLFDQLRITQNPHTPDSQRSHAWQTALDLVTDKRIVQQQVLQNVQPAQYKEPIIDKSIVDDRVLESYSPELHSLLSTGKTDTYAAFAIIEYFLRTNYHGLDTSQIRTLGQLFRPRGQNEAFSAYKGAIETAAATIQIPGKNSEETWIMRREIMDMLEITDHIWNKQLSHVKGKTIHITDLMRISADALRTVHATATFTGAQRVIERDRLLFKETEIPQYRNIARDSFALFLSRPDILLSMLTNQNERSFEEDFQKLLRLPESIHIKGIEHIPKDGSALIAFSHMNAWKDPRMPPNWELVTLISQVRRRRNDTIGLMAYLSYFQETAPQALQKLTRKLINETVKRAKETYNIQFLEVQPKHIRELMQQTRTMTDDKHIVLMAPEGIAAREILRPKRGIGSIARLTNAPVIGVAFREEQNASGRFDHSIIFTQPLRYGDFPQDTEQQFADRIMKGIAKELPEEQQGIFRLQ